MEDLICRSFERSTTEFDLPLATCSHGLSATAVRKQSGTFGMVHYINLQPPKCAPNP